MLPDFSFVTHEFPDREDIRIHFIADLHKGAREHKEEAWKRFCEKILEDDRAYVVLGGDLLNNSTRSSIANIWEETCRPSEAKRQMIKMLAPLVEKKRILCGTPGNHERRSVKDVDDDPMFDIMCKLDIEDLYRENIVFLRLRFGNNRSDGRHNPTYIFVVTHGAGGGKLPGAAVNNASRFAQYFDGIDGLFVAHTHRPFDVPDCKVKVDSNTNTISVRPFPLVSASSWLDYGGYPVQKLLPPTATVPQVMHIHGKKKQIDIQTIYEF